MTTNPRIEAAARAIDPVAFDPSIAERPDIRLYRQERARELATAALAAADAAAWRPIDDDTPLGKDLLLASPVLGVWKQEVGWAGAPNTCGAGYSNGWRHGYATHYAELPPPPHPGVADAGGEDGGRDG